MSLTFVPRTEVAAAAARAPVIDGAQVRADIDEVLDQESLPGG